LKRKGADSDGNTKEGNSRLYQDPKGSCQYNALLLSSQNKKEFEKNNGQV
jgi:hypothetical protein